MPMGNMGWIPDHPDKRDLKYTAVAQSEWTPPVLPWWKRFLIWLHILSPPAAPVPNEVDLRGSLWPGIYDQGQLGSCTSNAISGHLGFLEAKEGHGIEVLSRLFIYYNGRGDSDKGFDSGLSIRDGIKSVASNGVPLETLWPYDLSQWQNKPSDVAYAEAGHRKDIQYLRLESLQDMLQCLAAGYPFVFGASLYESFNNVDAGGAVSIPSTKEKYIGGHALCVVGYNLVNREFIVRNSWGDGWGDHGYCYFPFDYLTDSDLASDFWTIRSVAK